MSIKNQQQETEYAGILLERIMTIAELLIRRSEEDQVELPDDTSESSEKTQESKPDVD